jgi:hypothetical protein
MIISLVLQAKAGGFEYQSYELDNLSPFRDRIENEKKEFIEALKSLTEEKSRCKSVFYHNSRDVWAQKTES